MASVPRGNTTGFGWRLLTGRLRSFDQLFLEGIESEEAFGGASLIVGASLIAVPSIPTTFGFGTVLGVGEIDRTLTTVGNVSSLEGFGAHIVAEELGAFPDSITSSEAFGAATIERQDVFIFAGYIDPPSPQFGSHALRLLLQDLTGIGTLEAFGDAELDLIVDVTGVASSEAFGNANAATGETLISDMGSIDSLEAFGVTNVAYDQTITLASGVASAEAFGALELIHGIGVVGLVSREAFGSTTINVGEVRIEEASVPSSHGFGAVTIVFPPNKWNLAPAEELDIWQDADTGT